MAHSRETGVSWKPELPTAAQPSTRGGTAPGQEGGMTSVLFTNVRIFDGTGALAYPGEVLVQGNRISRISRGARARGDELGQVREGHLADLLLVDGDPVANIAVLQDAARLLGVMKDGVFHKDPQKGPARGRFSR